MLQGHVSLQVTEGAKPYLALPSCMEYALQEPIKKELGCPQEMQIIVPVGVEKTSERWCNSFVLVPKPNGTVYLDPARLDHVLIRPVHRVPTVNNMLPTLTKLCYLTLIDPSSIS